MSVNQYIVQCNAQNSAKTVVTKPVGSKFILRVMQYCTKGPENSHYRAAVSVGYISYLSYYYDDKM
jgi:hypothetical protein